MRLDSILNLNFIASFLFSVIRVSTPIIYASLGALIAQRSGVINLAIEGVMLVSALAGVLGSYFTNSIWVGLLCGILAGILMSLLLGYTVIIMKSNLILTCVALNLMASGGTVFLMYLITQDKGTTTSLASGRMPNINIPILKDIPFIGDIFSGHSLMTYLALISVVVVSYFLWKTPLGLRIRAVGENDKAAESVGINSQAIKLIALALSGAFAGLGGVYMSMGYLSWFAKEMVSGRGFIGLSAMNLGNATPSGSFFASLVFGFSDAVSNVLQSIKIPVEFIQMIPYVATIIGLVYYSKRMQNKEDRWS